MEYKELIKGVGDFTGMNQVDGFNMNRFISVKGCVITMKQEQQVSFA